MIVKLFEKPYLSLILVLLAGGIFSFGLAPFNIWPVALISVFLLLLMLDKLAPKNAFWCGWFYGLGFYGVGVSWVYVSIHDYGYAPIPLAVLLTFFFVAGLSLLSGLQAYVYVKFIRDKLFGVSVGFTVVWVLFEWIRGWILTGFPWLYVGDTLINTPVVAWAPIIGVLGVSFLGVLLSTCLYYLVKKKFTVILVMLAIFISGYPLRQIDWVTPTDKFLTVSLVQGNVSQEVKWNPDQVIPTIRLYEELSVDHWSKDIIIWPESAIPALYQHVVPVLDKLAAQSKLTNTGLITGIPYLQRDSVDNEAGVFHNSIIAIGEGEGIYHKQRLVPFGEYVPLESWLRGLIAFFNLPMSQFKPGPSDQSGLIVKNTNIAPFVCYEIVYSDFVARNSVNADLLVTISNDTWFGASIGPHQHLQIARMRALENGRYLLRATNNGISAIIDHHGEIIELSDQFTQQVITGTVQIMKGMTPFAYWRSLPVLVLSIVLLLLLLLCKKRKV